MLRSNTRRRRRIDLAAHSKESDLRADYNQNAEERTYIPFDRRFKCSLEFTKLNYVMFLDSTNEKSQIEIQILSLPPLNALEYKLDVLQGNGTEISSRVRI